MHVTIHQTRELIYVIGHANGTFTSLKVLSGRFKMAEEQVDVQIISLHGCIRNTSIDATILTEHWLKTNRTS